MPIAFGDHHFGSECNPVSVFILVQIFAYSELYTSIINVEHFFSLLGNVFQEGIPKLKKNTNLVHLLGSLRHNFKMMDFEKHEWLILKAKLSNIAIFGFRKCQ